MRKNIAVLAVCLMAALSALVFQGCAGCEQDLSHMKSGMVGLHRRITVYANDGRPIRTWETKGTVEDQGGSFRFVANGKAITVAGTVVIEEL